MLRTYQNLSVVLTCQEKALEATLASKPITLTPEEVAVYDSLRLPTLHSLLVFLVEDGAKEDTFIDDDVEDLSIVTPIQSICRVIIPIVALQDQFLPYRRSTFTRTLTDYLFETLTSKIDLEACWATCAEVMVWATMFGVYISRGISQEKEVWFSKELVKGVRGRKGQLGQLGGSWNWGWNAVRNLLIRFYWCEGFFGDEFRVSQISGLPLHLCYFRRRRKLVCHGVISRQRGSRPYGQS